MRKALHPVWASRHGVGPVIVNLQHLKELEDFKWFPSALRDFQTEFLGFVTTASGVYRLARPRLNCILQNSHTVTDLCSGSGQPAVELFEECRIECSVLLTDKYPNHHHRRNKNNFTYAQESFDVLQMKFDCGKYYTMLNAFHHFTDDEKTHIVHNLVRSGSRACIVEILEPGIVSFLKVFFVTTLGCLLVTPFIKPFSLKRLFWTYVLPINVLTIFYDGMISVFKSRTLEQYKKLLAPFGKDVQVNRLNNWLHSVVIIEIESHENDGRYLEIQQAAYTDREHH